MISMLWENIKSLKKDLKKALLESAETNSKNKEASQESQRIKKISSTVSFMCF